MEESKYKNFHTFLVETHHAIFLKLRWLVPVVSFVVTITHYLKVNHMLVIWHMLPALIWGLGAFGFNRSRSHVLGLCSRKFLQIYTFLAAYGVMSTAAIVTALGLFEIHNGPSQIVLVVAVIGAWDEKYFVSLLRIFFLGLFMVMTTHIYDNSFAELTMQHVLAGFVYAAIISKIIQTILKRNFELESQIYNKQILITQSASKSLFPHQIAMIGEGAILEDTIDVSEQTAYLIEFDIKNSSSIKGSLYEKARKACFSQIQKELIYCNYLLNPQVPNRPYSNAYKVKELGDGFIISVGHPFELPLHTNPAETLALISLESINIAKRCFQKIMQLDVHFAVTIASAKIKPFWTATPGSQLDFEQKGLTKICRLSEFRRVLEREQIMDKGTDTILVDQESFLALRGQLEGFEPIKLSERQLTLRNYPMDEVIYLHTIGQTALIYQAV